MGRLYSPQVLGSLLRPRKRPPTAQQRAAENDLAVLKCIARYGHLTAADLGAAVWPSARYGQDMAQRSLRRLSRKVQLRQNALGGNSFVLNRAGVALLEVNGIAARHGLSLAAGGPNFRHHSLTARYLIERENQGCRCWHEYAVAQGMAPLTQSQLIAGYGKLPDGLVMDGDRLYLVEVESAPKHQRHLMRACAILSKVGRRLVPEVPALLGGLIFVFTEDQEHETRIARACRRLWFDQLTATEQARLAAHIQISKVAISLPLVWHGCTTAPLALQGVGAYT